VRRDEIGSLAETLLIRPKTTVWTSHPHRLDLIQPLPEGVRVVDRPEHATTVLIFGHDAQSLRNALAAHASRLAVPETLWVAYPKGHDRDVDRDSVRSILVEHYYWPIGEVALDDRWSATRFRPVE
jgi:hypothetical protein